MAIQKCKNTAGRVVGYVVVAVVPNPNGGRGTRHVIPGTFRRKADADAAERKAKDAIQAGTFRAEPMPAPKAWTVRDVVRGWLAGRKATVTANTHSQYESAFRLHLDSALGDRDIAGLTRADVRAALRGWQDAGMGAQLQNRTMLVLRCALDEAVEDGILTANPAAGISLPSPKQRRDLPHWTADHLLAFLEEGERDQSGVFWHLTALEGMRRAEALGLRWRDLQWTADESGCRATIVQTVVPNMRAGGTALIQPRAKTKGSQRTVTLTGPTVAALKRHRDRQVFQREAVADTWADIDLIVADTFGRAVRPDAVATHRRQVVERASVPSVRTHDLRHLAATTMLRGGISPALVAAKIGHSDISVTVGTYGHITADDQAPANAALEQFLASATGTGDS